MSNKLKELFANTQSALANSPGQAVATFSAESHGHGGLYRKVKIRDFTVEVDEPASTLVCTRCRTSFPVRDAIPVMLLDEATAGPNGIGNPAGE